MFSYFYDTGIHILYMVFATGRLIKLWKMKTTVGFKLWLCTQQLCRSIQTHLILKVNFQAIGKTIHILYTTSDTHTITVMPSYSSTILWVPLFQWNVFIFKMSNLWNVFLCNVHKSTGAQFILPSYNIFAWTCSDILSPSKSSALSMHFIIFSVISESLYLLSKKIKLQQIWQKYFDISEVERNCRKPISCLTSPGM